jgi:hypothetical protein
MKKHSERHLKPYNVEFGMEFGDINASKLYDFPVGRKDEKGKARKEK